MVNTKDFGERIQKIMDYYAISASSFADTMGVGRSSISHILSGRNKPSLDFVMKIVEAYPEVELYWLLYNEGSFPKSEEKPIEEKYVEQDIKDTSKVSTPTKEQDLFSTSIPETVSSESHTQPRKDTSPFGISENKMERIVIFFDDGTFEEYTPKKS